MSEVSERPAAVLAAHRISAWSDWTYGCHSCTNRYEQTAEPFDLSEYGRLSKPDWTYEQAMAHVAESLAPVVEQMLAEARAEALREAEADHAEQVRMALEDQRERIGRAIEADRPEMGSDINVTPYRTGLFTGMNRAAGIARADAAEREAR